MEFTMQDELCAYLEFVTAKVPYYARRKDEYSPSRVRKHSFDVLPVLSKEQLRSAVPGELIPAGLDVARGLREGWLERLTSSGTTGGPISVVAETALPAFPKTYAECWGLAKDHPPLRTAVVTSPACSGSRCVSSYSDRLSARGTTLTLACPSDLFAAEDQVFAAIAEELEQFRPNLIFANPTYLLAFARRARALGLGLHRPSAIILSYQLAARSQIRALEVLFGVPVLGTYGASELAGCQVAFECFRRRMHVYEPHCFVEVLGRGVGPVVVTTVAGYVSPLIRYDIGDLAELRHEPCDCPLAGSPVLELHGRRADALDVGGRLVTSLEVDRVMSAIAGVDFYRCTQTAPHIWEIDAIPEPGRDLDAGNIRSALSEKFDVEVNVRLTDYLAPDRSLKFSLTRSCP